MRSGWGRSASGRQSDPSQVEDDAQQPQQRGPASTDRHGHGHHHLDYQQRGQPGHVAQERAEKIPMDTQSLPWTVMRPRGST